MGLVAPAEGPCAWQGQDIANSERWIRDLRPEHIGEIEAALTTAMRGIQGQVFDFGHSWRRSQNQRSDPMCAA